MFDMELYTNEEFLKAKFRDLLPLSCDACGVTFLRKKLNIHVANKVKSKHSCSAQCSKLLIPLGRNQNPATKRKCHHCDSDFFRADYECNKPKNLFCSSSCAGFHYNKNKKHGTSRSKLEVWLGSQLSVLYPNLGIHYNRRDSIDSELDIYIPELKLAFELNGIFHYEPIFGKEKLDRIQNNDDRKFAACFEKQISLCIIDTSSQKYFKPANSQKFLDIICNLISQKIIGHTFQ